MNFEAGTTILTYLAIAFAVLGGTFLYAIVVGRAIHFGNPTDEERHEPGAGGGNRRGRAVASGARVVAGPGRDASG